MNILNGNLECIECGCTTLIKDHKRSEIYCSHCGLILVDNSFTILDNSNNNIPNSKDDVLKLRSFFYGFNLVDNTPIYQSRR